MTDNMPLSRIVRSLVFSAAVLSLVEPTTAHHGTTRLITLGTRSGPLPTADRAQTSHAIVIGDSAYLFDAGDGAARALATAGVSIRNIDAIFISHLHDDHTSGLVPVLSVEYELDRAKPVGVYGPPSTKRLADAAVQFLSVNGDIRVSDGTRTRDVRQMIEGHDVAGGVVYTDANITVRAVENSHFNFKPGSPSFGATTSLSYRVETRDRTIVFTGDTGPSDAVASLAKGADVLVTEISAFAELRALRVKDGSWDRWTPEQQTNYQHHMTQEHLEADEVAKLATRAGVKMVVLTHLSASGILNDDYARFANAVRQGFAGRVVVARDGGEY